MRRDLFAATALTSVAFAHAPQAVAQTYNWTGYYIGGVAGYAGLSANPFTIQPYGTPSYPRGVPALARIPLSAFQTPSLGGGGFTGGATLGYNRQTGHLVVGVETDFSSMYTRAGGSFARTSPIANGTQTATYNVSAGTDWLYTLRGRIGYAQDRWLVFGTGGLALGGTHLAGNFASNQNALTSSFTPLGFPAPIDPAKGTYVTSRYGSQTTGFGSHDDVRVGYVLGGGVEYALTNRLTLKLEGLYYDLGADNLLVANTSQYRASTTTRTVPFLGGTTTTTSATSGSYAAQPYAVRYRFDGAIVRVGANYHF